MHLKGWLRFLKLKVGFVPMTEKIDETRKIRFLKNLGDVVLSLHVLAARRKGPIAVVFLELYRQNRALLPFFIDAFIQAHANFQGAGLSSVSGQLIGFRRGKQ